MSTDEEDCVKVIGRIRPFLRSSQHDEANETNIVQVFQDHVLEVTSGARGQFGSKTFQLHRVLGQHATQHDVFQEVSPILEQSLVGYSCSFFAYGQSGSGKTHTMLGNHYWENPSEEQHQSFMSNDDDGLIPRSMQWLFQQLSETKDGILPKISVSYLEIHNEHVIDLLVTTSSTVKTPSLEIREYKRGEMYVPNLTTVDVTSIHEVMDVLLTGVRARSLATTDLNDHSSRSHTIFQCYVELYHSDQKTITRSKISFIDLAGSEKLKAHQCSNFSRERIAELKSINRSLSTLGACISALSQRKRGHIPYRDSKLTRLLQDALGGSTKTIMIVTLSPSSYCYEETISTLQFADRAMRVQISANPNRVLLIDEVYEENGNNPITNTNTIDQEEVEETRKEVLHLREMVAYLTARCHDSTIPADGRTHLSLMHNHHHNEEDNEHDKDGSSTNDSIMADTQFHQLVETSKTNFRDAHDGNTLSIEWLRQYHAWLLTDAQSQYEKMITLQTTTTQDNNNRKSTVPMVPLKAVDQLYDRICMMETSILVQAAELQRAKGLFTKTNTELQSKYMTVKMENQRLRKQLDVAKHRALLNGTTEAYVHSNSRVDCDGDDQTEIVPVIDILSQSNLQSNVVDTNNIPIGTTEINNNSGNNSVEAVVLANAEKIMEIELGLAAPAPARAGVSIPMVDPLVVISSISGVNPIAIDAPPTGRMNNENNNNNAINGNEKNSKDISLMTKQHNNNAKQEAIVTIPAVISEAALSVSTSSSSYITSGDAAANATSVGTTISTDPSVVSLAETTTSTAAAAANKGQQRRKLLWRAVIDPTTSLTYFYNRKTKQTTWDRPIDHELELYCD